MLNISESWLNLIHMVTHIEAELSSTLQLKHRLGLTEYRALVVLSQSPNSELRMQELATYLHLNQSSVSRMVERLERSGFTYRDLCPNDKRGVYTVLTDKGRTCLVEAKVDYELALAQVIKETTAANLLTELFGELNKSQE